MPPEIEMTENDRQIKVTVYTPSKNYGRFLAEAMQSVIDQTMDRWELIIIDDGAQDETASVAARFEAADPGRVRVFRHDTPKGLQACSNVALREARGEYLMRLDADDYLDENALLVMANYLDRHPDIALVYPNYTLIDEEGKFLALEQRKKIGKESQLLDLPAHGACTMVRRRVLKAVGGYSQRYDAQDGYEMWLKLVHRYPVANISTPLFAYRQHSSSLTRDEPRILNARQRIKRDLVERNKGEVSPRTVAVIPAKNSYRHLPNIVLAECGGRPLIDYALLAATETTGIDLIVVTTDDPAVEDYCKPWPGVKTHFRPVELSAPAVRLSVVLADCVSWLERECDVHPDILVILSVHSPLRRPEHVRKAMDTLLLFNVDSVISVYEDLDLHFTHGSHGLVPLNAATSQRVRLEREALYVDNGAVKAVWRDKITPDDYYGRTVGHVVMPRLESLQIKDPPDLQVADLVLRQRSGEVALGV